MNYLMKGFYDATFKEFAPMLRESKVRLLGHLPTGNRDIYPRLTHSAKMNRYLRFQEARIRKAIEEGNFEKATLIGLILLKSSVSYQMVLFNRSWKGGYGKYSADKVRKTFITCVNTLRKWDLELFLERFYVRKPNGKYRPIGSPDIASKMICKAFSDMVIAMNIQEIPENHHGFLPNRGIHTAILQIMCKYYVEEKTDIYEFDLRSGFNRVNPSGVREKLSKTSETLANQIYGLIHKINYKFKDFHLESEMVYRGCIIKNKKWKPLFERYGMPQGLPFSPILSTIALSNMPHPEGLIMYADDGVIMGCTEKDMKGFDSIAKVGAEIAEEKSRLVKDGILNFLGFRIDFPKKTVRFGINEFIYDEWNPDTAVRMLKGLLSLDARYTSKETSGGTGEISPHAYINRLRIRQNPGDGAKTLIISIGKGGNMHGYRKFPYYIRIRYKGNKNLSLVENTKSGLRILIGEIVYKWNNHGTTRDVSASSSYSINELVKDIKGYKLGKRGKFKGIRDFTEEIHDKGTYCEYLSETAGIARENISILQEDMAVFMMS